MASANFTNLALHLATGAIDFSSDSFKCMMVTVVPSAANLDTWVYRASVANESTDASLAYVTGGVPVILTVGSLDTANNRVPIAIASLAPGWSGTEVSAAAAIIYKDTGNAATDPLICMVDFGGTLTAGGNNFSIIFSTPLYING